MDWTELGTNDALAGWFEAWVGGFIAFFAGSVLAVVAVAVPVGMLVVAGVHTVRRRFWCRGVQREVEVEFERRPWIGGYKDVKSCTAFECSTAVTCQRRCLDSEYRRQWEPALPIIQRYTAE